MDTRIFLLKNRSVSGRRPPTGPSHDVRRFRLAVWAHYHKEGRHDLPWRKTRDPYRILVSEVMLQQTQVDRVIPFYTRFIKKFPTSARLASSSLASVLQMWQGLGYNRRAKLLHAAAKELAGKPRFVTRFNLVGVLEDLPGVGPYTARAVAAFAFNADVVFVETNIRTAVMHHFFRRRKSVGDTELVEVLRKLLPKGKSREWYSALMDYGAYLKRSGVKLNTKSKHYAKQSKFSGSAREARGAILRELAKGHQTKLRLLDLLGDARRAQLTAALKKLIAEGLVQKTRQRYALAE